jgi:hypothetical protein
VRLLEHRVGHVEPGDVTLRTNLERREKRVRACTGPQVQHLLALAQWLEVEVIPDAGKGLERSRRDFVEELRRVAE